MGDFKFLNIINELSIHYAESNFIIFINNHSFQDVEKAVMRKMKKICLDSDKNYQYESRKSNIELGQIFETFNEADESIKEWGLQCGYVINRHHSHPKKGEKGTITYYCNNSTKYIADESRTTRTNCPFLLYLYVNKKHCLYRVTKVVDHDHNGDKNEVQHFLLTKYHKRLIIPYKEMGLNNDQIIKIIEKWYNIKLTRQGVKNICKNNKKTKLKLDEIFELDNF